MPKYTAANHDINETSCTACGKHAATPAQVDDLFGVMFDGTNHRPQGQCRACRAPSRLPNISEVAAKFTFGVEIEYTNSVPRDHVAREIKQSLDAGGAYTRHLYGAEFEIHTVNGWTTLKVVYDGSVRNGGEVVMPPLTLAEMDILQTTVRAMRRAGCQSSPHAAGIHVHVGAHSLDAKQIKNIVRYAYRWENHIKAAANTNPNRQGWCRDMVCEFVSALEDKREIKREDIQGEWYDKVGNGYGSIESRRRDHYDNSRYRGINLHSLFWNGGHGTIEFRYFDGTLHAGKIRAYVVMCLHIIARGSAATQATSKRKTYTQPSDVRSFLRWLDIPRDENKSVFFHLENNARAHAGLPLKAWS